MLPDSWQSGYRWFVSAPCDHWGLRIKAVQQLMAWLQKSFQRPQGSSVKYSSFFQTRLDILIFHVCEQKHFISWQHKEEGMNEPVQSVSSVLRLFADEILAFIFCFKREECMPMPAEHEVLLPRQLSPFFWKLSSPGSSGDVITVQSTCKTHSPGECISLIDHSWLLFLTARIRKWLLCSLPLLKCTPRCHNREKRVLIHKMHADNQSIVWVSQYFDLVIQRELLCLAVTSKKFIIAENMMCNITHRWKYWSVSNHMPYIAMHNISAFIFRAISRELTRSL